MLRSNNPPLGHRKTQFIKMCKLRMQQQPGAFKRADKMYIERIYFRRNAFHTQVQVKKQKEKEKRQQNESFHCSYHLCPA